MSNPFTQNQLKAESNNALKADTDLFQRRIEELSTREKEIHGLSKLSKDETEFINNIGLDKLLKKNTTNDINNELVNFINTHMGLRKLGSKNITRDTYDCTQIKSYHDLLGLDTEDFGTIKLADASYIQCTGYDESKLDKLNKLLETYFTYCFRKCINETNDLPEGYDRPLEASKLEDPSSTIDLSKNKLGKMCSYESRNCSLICYSDVYKKLVDLSVSIKDHKYFWKYSKREGSGKFRGDSENKLYEKIALIAVYLHFINSRIDVSSIKSVKELKVLFESGEPFRQLEIQHNRVTNIKEDIKDFLSTNKNREEIIKSLEGELYGSVIDLIVLLMQQTELMGNVEVFKHLAITMVYLLITTFIKIKFPLDKNNSKPVHKYLIELHNKVSKSGGDPRIIEYLASGKPCHTTLIDEFLRAEQARNPTMGQLGPSMKGGKPKKSKSSGRRKHRSKSRMTKNSKPNKRMTKNRKSNKSNKHRKTQCRK
jgi:hypothetical protein